MIFSVRSLGFFFICGVAQASAWQGLWRGQGVVRLHNGVKENCSLQIEIESTPKTFFVKGSEFRCQSFRIRSRAPQVLEIRQASPINELWLGGRRLGSISNSEVHTQLQSADGRRQNYDLVLSHDEPILIYHDFVQWSSTGSTEMQAQLRRVELH